MDEVTEIGSGGGGEFTGNKPRNLYSSPNTAEVIL